MTWWWAVAAGVVLGVIYTLSPLAVLSLGALTWATRAAGRGLSEGETRWFWCLIVAAVALRLAAIAALVVTADPTQPFASFFGDEVLYKARTVWLRNLGQGIPMSPADVIYGVDAVGLTAYTYVLALLQAVVGDAPYGLHVMNMTLYLAAVLALYRLVRASYGTAVSLAGLMALLFLPSLIFWSISVLKEPITVFMLAGELMCALAIVRAPHYWQKALAAAGVALFAIAMENLRTGGLLTAALGTVGGISLSFALARGRRLAGVLVAAPIAIAIVASSAAIQERVVANLRHAASYHAGHVQTPGYSYRLLELRYYGDRNYILNQLPPGEAGRFAIKAAWSYFAQPLPWQAQSRALRAYLPEQIVWYVMALLLPLGVIAGMRRDKALTSLLVMHAAGAVAIVALSSGNIGTLIRHRSLAFPYLVWLSALGGHELVRLVVDHKGREGSGLDGDR
jgi:hypothetical protein